MTDPTGDVRRDCCWTYDESGAKVAPRTENLGPAEPTDKPDLTLRRCTVCGARHFTLTADPGELTGDGASLSSPE